MKIQNSNIEELFCKLDDRHFSFFYNNRKTEFSHRFQLIIEEEKKRRKLSQEKITEYIQVKEFQQKNKCLRCQSNLRFVEIDRIFVPDVGSYSIDVHSWKCIVCGFNPHKDKALNWKMWLKKNFIGFGRKTLARE